MQKANAQTRRVVVMGTGSWGTTLAILSARQGLLTHLLARTEDEANTLRTAGENTRFMPGYPFPQASSSHPTSTKLWRLRNAPHGRALADDALQYHAPSNRTWAS